MVRRSGRCQAKEIGDNSQTKSDYKDALTIAALIVGGHYFDAYLPEGLYAELRVLTNMRVGEIKRANAVKNTIVALMDEWFPEFEEVFKNPLKLIMDEVFGKSNFRNWITRKKCSTKNTTKKDTVMCRIICFFIQSQRLIHGIDPVLRGKTQK